MIVDVTGIELIPGNGGKDCPGNGSHPGMECCCDECDYALCCWEQRDLEDCKLCMNQKCPRAERRRPI